MKRAVSIGIGCAVVFLLTAAVAWSQEQSQPASTPGPSDHRLVGIVTVEGKESYAAAVFEFQQLLTKQRQQKLYRVGDTINGATIAEIEGQHVVLQRGEQIELVGVTADCAEGDQPADANLADSSNVADEARDPKQQAREQVLSKQLPPYDPRVAKKAASRDQVNRFVEHFQQQMEMEVEPVFVATSLGLAVSLTEMNSDLLDGFGLQPTDLIVGISGMGIDSLERLALIFGVLNRAKLFDLAVLRDDAVEYLAYEIRAGQ